MKQLIVALAVSAFAAGCAVQPAQHATLPDAVGGLAPATWDTAVPAATSDAATWWAQFRDPTLDRLIATVLDANLDLQAAAERVKQAQALTASKRAALLPELDATAHASDARQNVPPPLGYVRQAGAGLALSWSPDVFGGERLDLLAARAQLVGQTHAEDAMRLALAADAASAYVDLRWAQQELKLLQDNAAIRQRALELTRKRQAFGLSTELDVTRAKNQLDALEARIAPTRAQIAHQLNLIAVYSGRTPESIDRLVLAESAPIPAPPAGAPVTLPSQALLRRPDVLTAYAQVERRAAQVGVAKAERYPKFSLNLADGVLAASYLGLPTLTDNLFSAALSATSPIFDAGRIAADIAQSESRLRESELALRQTMLQALREVEDARASLVATDAASQQLGGALAASDRALALATRLYKGGATDFLDVLTAQEAYLRDSDSLNQAAREHALAAIALYRSLGGGWSRNDAGQAAEAVASQ
ncbi:efflux transporter outer membrane subunit [Burkholderia multivorans]|uniref:efflux transporter outer membrane subunit n=1 Tax=Burkholderia multivorans TaxID=87883 RepID=UPI001C2192B2|nr:efflux transporter outer membrane subunit [Burkholderia multivorans]MBU9150349.1 efflux transporter outer membrane subunit [Burkholderia multivorans]MBU9484526.1 efflux transporter outer membrane subunit [Burkholderia multivorans]MBY4672716.1 efflux transporter outer membrane subunit [Burkholderia multivorans]